MKTHIARALCSFVLAFVSFVSVVLVDGGGALDRPVDTTGINFAIGISAIAMACFIGLALIASPQALSQLWLFIVALLLGGALGGFLHKARVTAP